MDGVLLNLAAGFVDVFAPANLLALVIGLILGLLVAVLPGLTLVMGVVLALPFTYTMDITAAIILLTAMYVAGTYAGAWTSILFRVPGEPMDVPMLWDGYAMARKGEAAQALGWTLVAALVGGLAAALVMVLLAQPVARIALTFSTPEYFAIIAFGLASVVSLGGSSLANALISLFAGLLIATVGVDDTYGAHRFTFNVPILSDGIDYLVVMVGAFGLGEVFMRMEQGFTSVPLKDQSLSVSAVWGKSFQTDNRTFGHVINGRTGQPAHGRWSRWRSRRPGYPAGCTAGPWLRRTYWRPILGSAT